MLMKKINLYTISQLRWYKLFEVFGPKRQGANAIMNGDQNGILFLHFESKSLIMRKEGMKKLKKRFHFFLIHKLFLFI